MGEEISMTNPFDPETLRLLDESEEVAIETRRDAGAPTHRTIIWSVVVNGEVFVRSVRAAEGRWYREASSNPSDAALHVGDRRIPVRAVPATDGAVVEAVSEAYKSKYERKWPGPTAGMVRPEALPTTLRLVPA
jgi:hypothetical protein